MSVTQSDLNVKQFLVELSAEQLLALNQWAQETDRTPTQVIARMFFDALGN